MKQTIATFLLGVFVTISIAATSIKSDLLTIKPATPKSTICFYNSRCAGDEISAKVLNYSKQGYIVQNMVGGDCHIIITMIKY